MRSDLLAHSGRKAKGIEPQSYCAHIDAVREIANRNAETALHYRASPAPDFRAAIDWASLFHDLGKLEPGNQEVLATQERGKLPVNHVDAGVAHLFAEGQLEAALLAYCHHIGLCDVPHETVKHRRSRQDLTLAFCRDEKIKLRTDAALPEVLRQHYQVVPGGPLNAPARPLHFSGLIRRLLLSCLVDADHSDTAQNYG